MWSFVAIDDSVTDAFKELSIVTYGAIQHQRASPKLRMTFHNV